MLPVLPTVLSAAALTGALMGVGSGLIGAVPRVDPAGGRCLVVGRRLVAGLCGVDGL
ncbi:hypothetical protein [Micromonospora matsumotoense]|uniref:hypothetical protein n=1 Tax=Micromonospora matsumotoense TaxID=121616 RepID=UPI001FE0B6BB|nr:hypothetical protein [Micromonospora matsumotoense]